MKKLSVHGKLLDKYLIESGNKFILSNLKKNYLKWSNAADINTMKREFIKYDEFFKAHYDDIRNVLGSERKLATFVGHRLEEFVYLLIKDKCARKGLIIEKIPPHKIISWIGFNEDENLSVIGHGADLAIGQWRKITIKNGLSVGIERKEYFVPKIIIECKHYVSLDMFRDIVMESEMFKKIHPYSLFFIVCEILEMTDDFKKMKKVWEAYIDSFFAFRPGNRRNPGKLLLENINEFESKINDYLLRL